MTDHGWRVGDRVSLCPNGNESDRIEATVMEVDPPGLPRGVRVLLDHILRGGGYAYATHDELTLTQRAESSA